MVPPRDHRGIVDGTVVAGTVNVLRPIVDFWDPESCPPAVASGRLFSYKNHRFSPMTALVGEAGSLFD
jgi:hypothetical protein